jgi:hypothetical protein
MTTQRLLWSRLDQNHRIAERFQAAMQLWQRVKQETDALRDGLLGDKERLAREAQKGGPHGEVMRAIQRGTDQAEGLRDRADLVSETIDATQHKISEFAEHPEDDSAGERLLERALAGVALLHSLIGAQLTQIAAVRDQLRSILPA